MVARIGSMFLIFLCTTLAWMFLGSTLFIRTADTGVVLKERVTSTWGASQEQNTPVAFAGRGILPPAWIQSTPTPARTGVSPESGVFAGAAVPAVPAAGGAVTERVSPSALPLEASNLRVRLDLDPRRKGLLWYSTYNVAFDGTYLYRNMSEGSHVTFRVQLPAAAANYDGFLLTVNGAPREVSFAKEFVMTKAEIPPGQTAALRLAYRSQGLESWRYRFGADPSPVRDFRLDLDTNFKAIDFPDNSLSPSQERETGKGWRLVWAYQNLVSGNPISLTMPEKIQPGPVAARISLFAPVSLFFFFFVLLLVTTLRKIDLHPMNYFFLAAAFFAFHLLLAYLVDHVSIHIAFAISSVVSLLLVTSYLRLVVGLRFAAVEAGASQLLYLVLFSYAFFFKGYTGLTVTIGAILTLFAAMQVTGRIDWRERFAREAR